MNPGRLRKGKGFVQLELVVLNSCIFRRKVNENQNWL